MKKNNTNKSTTKWLSYLFKIFKINSLSIYQFTFITIVTSSVLSIIIISTGWMFTETNRVKKEIKILKENAIKNQEEKLHDEVSRLVSYLNHIQQDTLQNSKEQIKEKALRYFESIRFGNDGYVFVNTYSGYALLFNGEKLEVPKKMDDLNYPSGINFYETEMNLAKLPNGGSFQYEFVKLNDSIPYPKMSYIMGFDNWEWIIGAGDYLDNIDNKVLLIERDLKNKLYRSVLIVVIIFIPILILLLLFSSIIAKFTQNQFNNFVNIIKTSPLGNKDQLPFNQIYIRDLKKIGIDILQAEELVKQFGNIIDQLNTKIYIFSKVDLKFIHANKGAIQKGGYAIGKLQDKTILDILPTINRNQFLRLVEPLIQNKSDKILFESIFQRKDKTTIPIEVQLTLSFFDKKEVYVALIYDITERKKSEKNLLESENYNRLLFDTSIIGLVLTSMDGKLIDINPAFANIIGRTVDEIKQLTYWDITPEKYAEQEAEQLKSLEETGKYGPYEKEYIHKNGYLIPVLLQGSIIERNGQKYIWSSVEDITDRKRVEEELKKSEEKFSSAFYTSPAAMSIASFSNGLFIDVNNSFLNIFEFSREEVIGHKSTEINIIGSEERSKIMQKIKESGGLTNHELIAKSKSGKNIHLLLSTSPITIMGEVYNLTTMIEITDWKQTEAALRESEELLRLSTELANVAAWEYNFETDEMSRSRNHDSLYGLEIQKTWAFETFTKATHPDDRDMSASIIQQSVAIGGPDEYKFDFRVVYPDTSIHWLNVIGKVINRNSAGQGILVRGFLIDITERKQAEYKLIVSEKRYRALFENMTTGFVLFEVVQNDQGIPIDLIILAANRGFESTTGLNLVESIGKHLTKVLPGIEKDEADWIGTYSKVALTGESKQFELGSELLGYYYSVTAYQAGTNQCAVLFDDITNRKRIEHNLQESEIHFRQLFEDNPQPMWIYDLKTLQFKDVNETAINKYGYSKDEFLTMTLKEIRPAEDIALLIKNIEKSFDEFQETGVWRHQLKDGTIILVEISSHNLLFEDQPARLVLVHDVTERKKIEDALIDSHNKLQSALDSMTDAVFISDKEGNFIDFNEAFATFHKFKNKEECSKTFRDYPDILEVYMPNNEIAPIEMWAVPRALRGEKETNQIYGLRRKDTGERWVGSYSFGPVRDNNGNIVGSIVVGRDITELKLAEEELAQYRIKLEKLVKDRTHELEKSENALLNMVDDLNIKQKQLAISNNKLAEINKELETFTYSVSHDLKAPLRGIDGYSNLLQELYYAELNDEAKTFVNNIRNGTQQMNQIIEDLLLYSRLDRSLIKKTSARIDIFINHIIDLYQKELSDFHFNVDNKLPNIAVVADLDGLSIAFRNIFENAIKFTKSVKNPKIIIDFEEDDNFWHILVHDNGIGFDMKYYDKVFQIFQRLHRVEDYPGTGIGLAMVQKAMQRMDGHVWATSELGKGATFYLEIPKNIN
jgi:PAS domain S-box-containing protein